MAQLGVKNAITQVTPVTMVKQSGKVAFVTGANGISGHAITEHLTRTDKTKWYFYLTLLIMLIRQAHTNIGPKSS